MYQSQQFHTANYRGNQPGHDTYLRADSQTPSSYGGTQSVTSQYRGFQRPFQPTGTVSSVYGQSSPAGMNQTNVGMSSFSPSAGTQNYHTANYRGNQPGHDNYLRADSTQPAQSQFGGVSGAGQSGYTSSYSSMGAGGFGGAGVSSYNQNQFVSPESFHTANYRGNQPGHDNYLRADSTQPAQSQLGIGSSGTSYGHVTTANFSSINSNIGASNFGTSRIGAGPYGSSQGYGTSGYGATSLGTSSLGTSGLGASSLGVSGMGTSSMGTSGFGAAGVAYSQNQNQFASPESFHTANYRGNQPGHDNYLRADSTQPAQSQFGTSLSGAGFSSFSTTNKV